MPDTKITALAAITTVDPAADVLPIVDISDTSMAASGTTKKITSNQILGAGGTATLASATITGDLTVDTSTLKVDSANNRVGIGTASPSTTLTVGAASPTLRILDTNTSVAGGVYGTIDWLSSDSSMSGLAAKIDAFDDGGSYGDRAALRFFTNDTSANTEKYRIAYNGVATWSNVGGVAGTAMTLNATGLGVGVTPAAGDGSGVFKAAGTGSGATNTRIGLDVREITSGNAAGIWLGAMNSENTGVIGSRTASGNIAFQTFNGASWGERMRIDYLGNVGIGVTPSAWDSGFQVIENSGGSLWSGSTGAVRLSQNVYYATSLKYKNALAASQYVQTSGQHQWFTAASGTAGTTITDFATAKMTLDADGRLILLASTTTPATLATNGQLTFTATSNTNLRFSYRGSDGVTRTADLTLA